jgi:hypothetical protein
MGNRAPALASNGWRGATAQGRKIAEMEDSLWLADYP